MLEQSILQNYLDILREELVPATGCTEPIAIAYCAATLRELLGALPEQVDAAVSGNILKNVKSVVVPNTGGRKGIAPAIAVGLVAGDAARDLQVISAVTEEQLAELDLAYAPPYASAKDPVNFIGYLIENLAQGKVRQFHWHDVAALPRDGSVTLLDVRTDAKVSNGRLEGSLHIPVDELRERLGELDPAKPVYVNCQSGLRSYLACRILTQCGFTCAHLSGGYGFYQAVTQEQQRLGSIYPCGIEKA